jgi:V8-like Glu-specific endopeptidase
MMALDKKKKPLWRCTGTLISSTLFLTAGHCVEEPAASATIWFDTDVENGIPENGYPLKGEVSAKSIRIHPDYNTRAFYLHDLGMVKLTKPVKRDYYGELPVEGLLDELVSSNRGGGVSFTAVG